MTADQTTAPHTAVGSARCRATDADFTEFYRLFAPRLRAYALARYGPRDVEELVQETMTRAYLSLDGTRGAGEKWVWLTTVLRNLATDIHRSRRHSDNDCDVEQVIDHPSPTDGPDVVAIKAEQQRLVKIALGRLSVRQRQVLELYVLDARSCPAIARILASQPAATRKTLERARHRLLKEFRDLGGQFPVFVWPAVGLSRMLRRSGRGVRQMGLGGSCTIAMAGTAALICVGGSDLGPAWSTSTTGISRLTNAGGVQAGIAITADPATLGISNSVRLQRRQSVADGGRTTIRVPHTPMSPGNHHHTGVRIHTPFGTVVVDHSIVNDNDNGLLCSLPQVSCG